MSVNVNAHEWAVDNGVLSKFWIKIKLPKPAYIWKLTVQGREVQQAIDVWRLEGSTDDIKYDTLLSSSTRITTKQDYILDAPTSVAYTYYRIFAVSGSGQDGTGNLACPGLKVFQLYEFVPGY